MGEAAGHELASFLYAETGRLDQAASELQLCLKARMRFAPENGHRWRLLHQFLTGLVDVWLGDLAEAKQKLKGAKDEIASAKHKWHEFGTYWCGLLEGEIMLADSQPLQAIQIFKNVNPPNPWYLTWDGVALYRLPIARDGLARAYYAAGNLDHAIAEYRRLLTFNPESEERFLINPKYHYRLAKLYEETEARKLAIMEYQRFLDIWKDADQDLPDLIDAKKRLAKLKSISSN